MQLNPQLIEMRDRSATVRSVCPALEGRLQPRPLWDLVVDPHHHFSYCRNAKVKKIIHIIMKEPTVPLLTTSLGRAFQIVKM